MIADDFENIRQRLREIRGEAAAKPAGTKPECRSHYIDPYFGLCPKCGSSEGSPYDWPVG